MAKTLGSVLACLQYSCRDSKGRWWRLGRRQRRRRGLESAPQLGQGEEGVFAEGNGDWLAGEGDACGGKAGSSMCTVGLMLNGCAIDDTMPGSPSFLSGQIKVPSRVPAQRRASTSAH